MSLKLLSENKSSSFGCNFFEICTLVSIVSEENFSFLKAMQLQLAADRENARLSTKCNVLCKGELGLQLEAVLGKVVRPIHEARLRS